MGDEVHTEVSPPLEEPTLVFAVPLPSRVRRKTSAEQRWRAVCWAVGLHLLLLPVGTWLWTHALKPIFTREPPGSGSTLNLELTGPTVDTRVRSTSEPTRWQQAGPEIELPSTKTATTPNVNQVQLTAFTNTQAGARLQVGSNAALGLGHAPHQVLGFGQGTGKVRVPVRVLFLLDRSLSMGLTGALELAKQQVLASIKQLPDEARVRLACYDQTVLVLPLGNSHAYRAVTPAIFEEVQLALLSQRPTGRAVHLPALKQAFTHEPEVLVWFTDGDDFSQADAHEAQRACPSSCALHIVHLVKQQPHPSTQVLRALSTAKAGNYFVCVVP